jgi:hypothetical protein
VDNVFVVHRCGRASCARPNDQLATAAGAELLEDSVFFDPVLVDSVLVDLFESDLFDSGDSLLVELPESEELFEADSLALDPDRLSVR